MTLLPSIDLKLASVVLVESSANWIFVALSYSSLNIEITFRKLKSGVVSGRPIVSAGIERLNTLVSFPGTSKEKPLEKVTFFVFGSEL